MKDIWSNYINKDYKAALSSADEEVFASGRLDHIHVTGMSLMELGQIDEGIKKLRASVLLFSSPMWFANATASCLAHGRKSEALEFADDGLKLHPENPVLWFAKGNVFLAQERFIDAVQCFQTALMYDPSQIGVRLNLGACFSFLGWGSLAVECYRHILRNDPCNRQATINLVSTLRDMGHDDDAKKVLHDTAVKADELVFLSSMIMLAEGNYLDGWKKYRSRWRSEMAAELVTTKFSRPEPETLADIVGKHILVHHEQGFGDSLQFARYIPLLARHAGKVTVIMPSSMVRLIENMDTNIDVISTIPEKSLDHDYECGLMEMPRLFETTVETIPNEIPYFRIPFPVIEQRKLPFTLNKRVGLVWAGHRRPNPNLAAIDARRSMRLDYLLPLMDVPNIDWFNLQLGTPAHQLSTSKFGAKLNLCIDSSCDFLSSAATIKQLDLVITVDTSIAHLAGGLGVPTWVLSRHDACWRWLHRRSDSPWYPGVMRLFYQSVPGDWSAPIEEVRKNLVQFTTGIAPVSTLKLA